jgi:hypothetical protein
VKLESAISIAVGGAIDEVVDHLGYRPEVVDERPGILGEVGEHEVAIAGDMRDPLHVVLRIGEVEGLRIALLVRDRCQRTIRTKRPRVIGAGEQAARSAVDHAKPRAAMRAAVVQHVDLPVVMTGDDDLLRGEPGADEIAGLLQLAFVRDIDPEPAEDALLLEREHCGVGVGAAVHMVGPNQAADVVCGEWFNCAVHEGSLNSTIRRRVLGTRALFRSLRPAHPAALPCRR